ncbi:MAG: GNAT family N-acetyltransferase [Anaerolineae bacterium]
MTAEIRHVRVGEFEDFMRYVERAFGHSKTFFERVYPHLYQPTREALEWAYVIEEDGEIVSHVGLYPIETVTVGVRLSVGGIGAVSTAPSARGRGYMTQLLEHIVEEMRRIGYPVSWLGGDRQRYNTFGWEIASPTHRLTFTPRSLGWHDVESVAVEEVLPEEALDTMRRLQSLPACHTIRPHLEDQIQKIDLRFWVAEDGYAILDGQGRSHIRILELVSASGNEAGMIRAILNWTFADEATWTLSMWDRARIGRLAQYASYWGSGYSGMYRINDLTQLLISAQGYLDERAVALRDFAVAIGIVEHDQTPVTTLAVTDGKVTIEPGHHAEAYVELSAVEAARLVLGGLPIRDESVLPEGLQMLLPVPCHVLPLDHV